MKLTEYPLRDQTIQKTQMYAVRRRTGRGLARRAREAWPSLAVTAAWEAAPGRRGKCARLEVMAHAWERARNGPGGGVYMSGAPHAIGAARAEACQ